MRWLWVGLLAAVIVVLVMIFLILISALIHPAHAQDQKNTPSYFYSEQTDPCHLLFDERKKCASGNCDKQVIERLEGECLRDSFGFPVEPPP